MKAEVGLAVPKRPAIILEPSKGWVSLRLRELWEYRELLYFLTWRDVKIRYKQAVLGVAWAILQPFLTMVVFSVIFGWLLGIGKSVEEQYGIPYPIYSYVALIPWQLFAGSLQRAGTSLVSNANLLTKVFFPRLVIPISAVLANVVDFVFAFVMLLALMAYYGIAPTWNIVWLPLFVVLALATALAVSLWLSALNVLYRDVQYIIPFLVQLWMYLTPIIYPLTTIPAGPGRFIYGLNPMAGVVQGFRWALLGEQPPDYLMLVSTTMVGVLLFTGLLYFRRMERRFADVV